LDLASLRRLLEKHQRKRRSIVGVPASGKRQRCRGVSLPLLLNAEQSTPHRTRALEQCGPLQQTSLTRQEYRALRQPIGVFQSPLVRKGQTFLVLEPSLRVQRCLSVSRLAFHGRIVAPEKRDSVPDQRELKDFDLPLRCLTNQRLG